MPFRHGRQSGPPQSTSVSAPLCWPSPQLTQRSVTGSQIALSQSAPVAHRCPSARLTTATAVDVRLVDVVQPILAMTDAAAQAANLTWSTGRVATAATMRFARRDVNAARAGAVAGKKVLAGLAQATAARRPRRGSSAGWRCRFGRSTGTPLLHRSPPAGRRGRRGPLRRGTSAGCDGIRWRREHG